MNTQNSPLTTDQCPFCGNNDTAIGYEYQSRVYVFCKHCGARGPWTMGDDAGARLSWRTRDRDLLDALKRVVALSDRKHDAWDAAWAAIDKAEGRTNV